MERQRFEQAAAGLRGIAHKTPLVQTSAFSRIAGCQMYLKCENQQKTGSFKVRGAYHKISTLAEKPAAGVITSSAGNHAQGVAYSAAQAGLDATVVMPRTAPMAKIAATRGYGAQVLLHGESYDDAFDKAMALREESGAVFIPAFDDDAIIAGQGTVALEILGDLPTVDVVLVPCGGGGLLAGMAACIKQVNPRIRVIGVQARGADAVARSFREKSWQSTPYTDTIADGIAVGVPGKRPVELIQRYVDEMYTVSDGEIAATILLLLERCKLVVEPAGAAALAAAEKLELDGKTVACVLSGGNLDMTLMHRIVERGLVRRGRRLQFHTLVPDKPGSLQAFCNALNETGANLLMLQHDKLGTGQEVGQILLQGACELDDKEHGVRMIAHLGELGYEILPD